MRKLHSLKMLLGMLIQYQNQHLLRHNQNTSIKHIIGREDIIRKEESKIIGKIMDLRIIDRKLVNMNQLNTIILKNNTIRKDNQVPKGEEESKGELKLYYCKLNKRL